MARGFRLDSAVDRNGSEERDWLYAELRSVEEEMGRGDTAALHSASERVGRLEEWLGEEGDGGEEGWAETASTIQTARGHVERVLFRIDPAAAAYTKALAHLERAEMLPLQRARREANLRTYLGLTCLLGHTAAHWEEAVGHFDVSIRLREADPDQNEALLWGLSAAWLNRGDALGRLGGSEKLLEAIRCHETAATLLAGFDLRARPGYRTRLALCHLNIGAAKTELTLRHALSEGEAALFHYRRAGEVLRPGAEAGIEESKRMLAVVLANTSRARLLVTPDAFADSEKEAREALIWIEGYDTEDWELLNLDLTARLALCVAQRSQDSHAASAPEITDLVEEGLAHLRSHLSLGGRLELFETVAGQLFRCGAETYGEHLPRFLSDFLLDHLDPERGAGGLERSPSCHEAAVETLWRETGRLKHEGFSTLGTDEYERRAELESEWHRCRERLAEIRAAHFLL